MKKTCLEEMNRPVFSITPTQPQPDPLLARIEALEQRLFTLERVFTKTSALATAVRDTILRWPGPFTAQQIRDAVIEQFPDLRTMEEKQGVVSKIQRMEKQGFILCTFRAAGPHPNIYELAAHPPEGAGRRGTKRGARHSYESGFRAVVREALEHLPAPFTLAHLQAWVKEHKPALVVPQGSWSSTLYKLVDLGELTVAKHGDRGRTLKEYRRTEKRVAPNGDEVSALENAWREFRAGIKAEVPDYLTGLERGE